MTNLEILAKLISFPTVSNRPCLPLIDWAAGYLRDSGAHVEIFDGEENGKACLLARLGPDIAGGIVFAGHIDVVPVDDQPWSKPPFSLTQEGDNIYGRGSCDMKGFAACVMSIFEKVDKDKLKKPVYLALTYNEEVNMAGASMLVSRLKERNFKADWVWLGEPTEMQVVTAHKGTGGVVTTVYGVSAHSSLPHKGLSAIDLGVKICAWLTEKSEHYATRPVIGSPFDPPYSSINVGVINGGSASNIIADKCTIEWQYRLHPGDDLGSLFREYEQMLDNSIRPLMIGYHQARVETDKVGITPPFMAAEGGEAEKYLCSVTGKGIPLSVSYGTEAGFYQEIAHSVAICGPGSITKAHQTDECVPIADLEACCLLVHKAIAETSM